MSILLFSSEHFLEGEETGFTSHIYGSPAATHSPMWCYETKYNAPVLY